MEPHKIPDRNSLFRCRYCKKCIQGVDAFVRHKREYHEAEIHSRKIEKGVKKKSNLKRLSSLIKQPRNTVEHSAETRLEKNGEPSASCSKNPSKSSSAPPPSTSQAANKHQSLENGSNTWLLPAIKNAIVKLERLEETKTTGTSEDNSHLSGLHFMGSSNQLAEATPSQDFITGDEEDDDDDLCVVAIYPSSKPNSISSRNLLANSLYKLGIRGPLIDEDGIEVVGFALPEASAFFKDPAASSSFSDLVDPLALDQPEPEPNTSAICAIEADASMDPAFAITFPKIVDVAAGHNEHASAASLPLASSTEPNEPGDIASRSPTKVLESATETTEFMEASSSICTKADVPSPEQNIVIESVCSMSESTVFGIPSTETMETPVSAPPSQSSLTSDSGISINDSASEMDTEENIWCVNGVYPGKISFQKGNDEPEGEQDFKKNTNVVCKIESFTPAQTSRSKPFKFSPEITSEFSATPPQDSPSVPSTNNSLPKKDILPHHILQMKKEDDDDRDCYEYKCELCGELIAKSEDIEDHMRDVHESHLVYKCNMCKETFDQELALIWHSTMHFELICRICGGKFDGKYNLDIHMKREHGNLSPHLQNPESIFPTVPVNIDQSVPLKSSVSKTVRSSTGTSDNSGGVSSQSDTEKMTSHSRVPAIPSTPQTVPVHIVSAISQMAPPLSEAPFRTAPPSTPLHLLPPNSEAIEADASNLRAGVNNAQYIRRISELDGEELARTAKAEMDGKYKCAICQSRLSSKQNLTFHIRLHTGAKPFKCGYCPETFKNASKLKRHERLVHLVDFPANKPRTHSCKICLETFSSRARAKAHRIQNACKNLARLRCEYCDKTFSNPSELSSHEEEHHLCNDSLAPSPQTPSDSSCSLPPEAFLEISIEEEIDPSPNPREQAQDSSPESSTAPASETDRASVIQFHRHQEPEDNEPAEQELHPEMQFKCSYCPMVFPGKVRRHIHESQHHQDVQPQTALSSPPNTTLQAPPSITTSTDLQNPHQSNATIHPITFYPPQTQSSPPISEYSCNHCNKKFTHIKDLQVHERSHYVCRYCFQIFSDSTAWQKHLQMHTAHTVPESNSHSRQPQITQEAAPSSSHPNLPAALSEEKCNPCPPNSSQQVTPNQITAQFTDPEISNNEEQHIELQCPGCPSKFNTSASLNHHKRFHREKRKYKCNFCGQLLASLRSCRHHENRHTGNRPYKCTFCSKAFPSPVQRWFHEKKKHGVTSSQVASREELFQESSPPNPHCPSSNIPAPPKAHQSPSHPTEKHQFSAIRGEDAPHPHCPVCGEINSALSPCKCRKHSEISNQPYRCPKSSAQFDIPVELGLHKVNYPEATDAASNFVQEPNSKEIFHSACASTPETFISSKPYQCSDCFEMFPDDNLLQLHKLISCEGSTNKCSICLLTFPDLSSFKAHQSSHHQADSIPTEFQCRFCQTNFMKEFLRDLHETVAHKQQQGTPPRVPASSTQIHASPYYTFNHSTNWTTANQPKSRENTNRNPERFNDTSQTFSSCANPLNPSAFSNQSTAGQTPQLNMFQPPTPLSTPSPFQQQHSSLQPTCPPPNSQQRPYTCRFCGRSFFNPDHLIFHELNTHCVRASQQHLLRCRYCPQSFSIPSQLYDHEYTIHSSIKISNPISYYPRNSQSFNQPSAPSRFPTPTFPHPPFMSPNSASPPANNFPYVNTNFMQHTMTVAICRQQTTSLTTGFGRKPGGVFNQNHGHAPERPLHNNTSKW